MYTVIVVLLVAINIALLAWRRPGCDAWAAELGMEPGSMQKQEQR